MPPAHRSHRCTSTGCAGFARARAPLKGSIHRKLVWVVHLVQLRVDRLDAKDSKDRWLPRELWFKILSLVPRTTNMLEKRS